MSKATERKAKQAATQKRALTPGELEEIRLMVRNAATWAYTAMVASRNTALLPEGQKLAAQFTALAKLLGNEKNAFMARKLMELGYAEGEQVALDLNTGEIKPC